MNSMITPMLALVYDDHRHRVTFPCFVQPKLDGIRCLLNARCGYSRQGNLFATILHIQEAMEDTFRMCPNLTLDGELYSHTYHDNFNEIVRLVKKQRPLPEELLLAKKYLQYWIFDCHIPDADWTYRERLSFLRSLPVAYSIESPIKILDSHLVKDIFEVDSHYESFILDRYEGLMLRQDGPYEQCGPTERRSKFLMKRKPSVTEDFLIVRLNEGDGKCRGMVGSFILRTEEGEEFEAAVKFDFDKRKELWHMKEKLVSTFASVRFQNYTPDRHVPRHGRVIALRSYE